MEGSNDQNKPRKSLVGKVVSDKMDKTVVVMVKAKVLHPMYKKYVTRRKKFYVHDPENDTRTGDEVLIEECRPLSKSKRWTVREVKTRAVG